MDEQLIEVSAEEKQTDGGRILFADDVIATIAALAVEEVSGVSEMGGASGSIWSKKNSNKGVKVQVGTDDVIVDISVIVQYGYRIKEVCEAIQHSVCNAIETMTGLNCRVINVFVQGISFEQKKEDKKESLDSPVQEEDSFTVDEDSANEDLEEEKE